MSLRAICVLGAAVLIAAVAASGQAPAKRAPAPTFYLVINARTCDPDSINISGASNLPAGALIRLQISDFDQDAWEDYSDPVYASLKEGGLFQEVLHPKTGKNFGAIFWPERISHQYTFLLTRLNLPTCSNWLEVRDNTWAGSKIPRRVKFPATIITC